MGKKDRRTGLPPGDDRYAELLAYAIKRRKVRPEFGISLDEVMRMLKDHTTVNVQTRVQYMGRDVVVRLNVHGKLQRPESLAVSVKFNGKRILGADYQKKHGVHYHLYSVGKEDSEHHPVIVDWLPQDLYDCDCRVIIETYLGLMGIQLPEREETREGEHE